MNVHQHSWWLWIIRAVTTATFAVIAVLFPPLTGTLALYLYAAYVKLDGFLLIGLNTTRTNTRPWLLLAGVIALATGVSILLWSPSETSRLALMLAVLGVARGSLEAANAILSGNTVRERLLRVAGALLIISFGALMLGAQGAFGLQALVIGFALHAMATAFCQLAVGVEERGHATNAVPPFSSGAHVQARINGLPI